jgi:hypothetical protein
MKGTHEMNYDSSITIKDYEAGLHVTMAEPPLNLKEKKSN